MLLVCFRIVYYNLYSHPIFCLYIDYNAILKNYYVDLVSTYKNVKVIASGNSSSDARVFTVSKFDDLGGITDTVYAQVVSAARKGE